MADNWEEGVVKCISEKGKDLAGFRGYLYRLHEKPKPNAIKQRWQCTSTWRCNGKLWTDMDMNRATERGGHLPDCLPDPERVRLRKVVGDMKEAAKTATQPMPQVYRQFKDQLAADPIVAANFGDFHAYDSAMYRLHNKIYQNNPTTLADVHIPPDRQRTEHSNEQFVLHHSPDNSMILFTTNANVVKLSVLNNWSVDGMHSYIPRIYQLEHGQLWTIQAFWGSKLLPLVYVLTTSKTRQTYTQIIRILKDRAAELGVVLNPSVISCDFETGLLPVLNMEFPGTSVKGCHFHQCQAIYRKVQSEGLLEWYADRNDDQGRSNIRMLMASGFLPVDRLRGWFEYFVDTMPLNVRLRLTPILRYFDRFWLNTIDIRLWNMHQVQRRTNNNIEGWHSGFQKRVGKHPNPGFLKFVDALRAEQSCTETSIHQLSAGQLLVRPNKKYILVNQRINTLTDTYIGARNNNTYDAEMALVRGVSYNLSQPTQLSL